MVSFAAAEAVASADTLQCRGGRGGAGDGGAGGAGG